jgi:hypothetical protein
MGHVTKFLNGGGTPFLHSLNRAQLAMLEMVRDDFTPDQQTAIEEAKKHLGFDKPEESPPTEEPKP